MRGPLLATRLGLAGWPGGIVVPDRPVDGETPEPPPPQSYANGYKYRSRLQGPGLAGTLANMLVRFDLTHLDLRSAANGGFMAFESAWDVRFELASGEKLPHHLESYDPVTGRLRGRVRFASLADKQEFYLFIGRTNLSSTEENKAGTYQDSVCAWDARTGEDLTGNGRALTMTTVGQATVIGDAGSYNGSSSQAVSAEQPTFLDGLAAITLECFVDPADAGNTDGAIISVGPPGQTSDSGVGALIRWDDTADSGAAKAISAKVHTTAGPSRAETQANTQFTGPASLALAWASGEAASLLKDGVPMAPSNTPAAPVGTTTLSRGATSARVYLGRNGWAAGNIYWAGLIDEVRIYNVKRSAAQLAATRSNFFRPDLEVSFGKPVLWSDATQNPVAAIMSANVSSAQTEGVMALTTFAPVLPSGGTATITAASVTSGGGSVAITGGGTHLTYTRPVGGAAFFAEGEYTITVGGRTGTAKFFVQGEALALSTTYTNGYGWRTKFILPATSNKNGNIANYIMRLDETFANWKSVANGGQVENGAHLDFRVELLDGTKLDHDVTTYTPTTGRAVMEIRIPSFTQAADVPFYVYHGKAGLVATEEATVTPPVTPGNTRGFNLQFPNSFLGRGVPVAANDTVEGPIAMPDEEGILNTAAAGTTVDLAVLTNDQSGSNAPRTLASVSRPGFTANADRVRYTKVTGDTYPKEGGYTVSASGKTAFGTVLVREITAPVGGGGDFANHRGPMENGRPLFMADFEADPTATGKFRDVRSKRQHVPGSFQANSATAASFLGARPGVYKANLIAYLNPNRVNSWTRLAGGPTWTPPNAQGQQTFNDSLVAGNNSLAYLMPNLRGHANSVGNWFNYDRTMALGLGVTSLPLGTNAEEGRAAARGDTYVINWWKACALRMRKEWLAAGSPVVIFRWNWEGVNQDTGLQISNSNGKPNWYVAGLTQRQYNSMMRRCIAVFKEFGPGRAYHVFSPAFETTQGGGDKTYDSYFEDEDGEVGYTGACFSFHPTGTRTTTEARAVQAVTGGSQFPEGRYYPVSVVVATAKARGIPFMSMESSIGTPFGGAVNHGTTRWFGESYIALGELFNDPANYGYASYHAALDTDMFVLNKNVTCEVAGHSGNTQGGTVRHNTGQRIYTDAQEHNKDRALLAHRKYWGRKDLYSGLTIPAAQ